MKRIVALMVMAIIFIVSQSATLPKNDVAQMEEPRSYVSGEVIVTGPSLVSSNVEYTYTIEAQHSDVTPDPQLQILNPNTTATLTKIGATTWKFICSGEGAYYINVYGYKNDVIYSYDCFLIACAS
jgi:hypothetical protein